MGGRSSIEPKAAPGLEKPPAGDLDSLRKNFLTSPVRSFFGTSVYFKQRTAFPAATVPERFLTVRSIRALHPITKYNRESVSRTLYPSENLAS